MTKPAAKADVGEEYKSTNTIARMGCAPRSRSVDQLVHSKLCFKAQEMLLSLVTTTRARDARPDILHKSFPKTAETARYTPWNFRKTVTQPVANTSDVRSVSLSRGSRLASVMCVCVLNNQPRIMPSALRFGVCMFMKGLQPMPCTPAAM